MNGIICFATNCFALSKGSVGIGREGWALVSRSSGLGLDWGTFLYEFVFIFFVLVCLALGLNFGMQAPLE